MGDMFSELEQMGFAGFDDKELFDSGKPVNQEKTENSIKKEADEKDPKEVERESLFDKKYECPLCDCKFSQKAVRSGKTRLLSTDTDLRHKYKYFDPIKYDIIVCPKCGYAAMGQKSFEGLSSLQRRLLREQVQSNFKGLPEMGELYSYDEAIVRYKLALYSSIVKKSKTSERAYLCLKIAWLFRSKKEDMDISEENYEEKQRKCDDEEKEYLLKAYNGFGTAVQSEMFPICGMDEMTFNYLYAELARRTGDIDMAKKMVGTVLISKSATSALKEKARVLKELLMGNE